MARHTKGTPTSLNLWVLAQVFGKETTVANKLKGSDVPHIRRCVKAKLVTVKGTALELTPEGIAALTA